MTIDSSNATVVDHLVRNGRPSHLFTVDTAPGEQCYITIVRNARRDTAWTQQTADELRDLLRDLPGHPYVRLSGIRDLITVIWDGA